MFLFLNTVNFDLQILNYKKISAAKDASAVVQSYLIDFAKP